MIESPIHRLTTKTANDKAKELWGELGRAKHVPFSYAQPKNQRVERYLVGVIEGKNYITKGYSFFSFEEAFRMASERL